MEILKMIYISACSVLLTACYTDYYPEIESEPVLCMNSMVTEGEPINVELSHSWLYTDSGGENDNIVKDASVSVFVNGEIVGDEYIPCHGDCVRLIASSEKYGVAEAEVSVPASVVVSDVRFKPAFTDVTMLESDDKTVSAVSFTFNYTLDITLEDSSSSIDYFRYSCAGVDNNTPYFNCEDDSMDWLSNRIVVGELKYEAEPIFSEHIDAFDSVLGADAYGFTFFTDRQFAGRNYTLHLVYSNALVQCVFADNPEDQLDFELEISLDAVSESVYKYGLYQWQWYSGIIGDLGDVGLADPLCGYSNVSTGAGVVGARSVKKIQINLRDYLYDALRGS